MKHLKICMLWLLAVGMVSVLHGEMEPAGAASRVVRQQEDVSLLAEQLQLLRAQVRLLELQAMERFAALEQERDAYRVALRQARATILQLEGKLERAEADWGAERAQLLVQLSQSTLQAALQEMSRMEEELVQMAVQHAREQAQLQARIADLERALVAQASKRAELPGAKIAE